MIYRYPSYLKKFRCSASLCSDNCCIGWEIDIDTETAEYYKSIEGEFGKKLEENISRQQGASFILKGERCPFLNEKNLCEIIINLGEESLCDICTRHPRFFGWYGKIKEGGVGLCCEEGAKLILSAENPLDFCEEEIDCEESEELDEELFSFLYECRERIFEVISDEDISFRERIFRILDFAENIQYNADNYNYSAELSRKPEYNNIKGNLKNILECYRELEAIDGKWTAYLEEIIADFKETEYDGRYDTYARNIFLYFVYRYFLQGVFDEEILSKVKLAAVSTAIIIYIIDKESRSKKLTVSEIADICKLYSKEVEYSQENLDMLSDMSYEKACWSTENIKGVF